MTKEEKKYLTCESKEKFTHQMVKETVDILRKEYGRKMGYYQCPYCKFWHLTRVD